MKLDEIYPHYTGRERLRDKVRNASKIIFLFSCAILAILYVFLRVNGLIIAIWCIWMAWSLVISPPLIERNAITFICHTMVYICILLALIHLLLAPFAFFETGMWIFTGGIAVFSIIFFLNIQKYRSSVMLMLWTILIAAITDAIYIHQTSLDNAAVVMVTCVITLLVVGFLITLGRDIIADMKKYFHT